MDMDVEVGMVFVGVEWWLRGLVEVEVIEVEVIEVEVIV